MYDEDDLLPISALQHLAFCERQWALIHLEGMWDENPLTVEGRHLHDRVHAQETEVRGDIRIVKGLRLRSLRLGLTGMADVVEFHRKPEIDPGSTPGAATGVRLSTVRGLWKPLIVEYKRGRPKLGRCDEVQLCAQAMCLEEMLGIEATANTRIASGDLFYGTPRRRTEVIFHEDLRTYTERLSERLHMLTVEGKTPAPDSGKKCKSCSLVSACMPKNTASQRSARHYLDQVLADTEGEEV